MTSLGNCSVGSSFNTHFFDLFLGTAPLFFGVCFGGIVVKDAFVRRIEDMFL